MLEISYQNEVLEAGCDEAGRGCLAGPVFAAAVILPSDFYDERLNDSKKMTEKNRYILRDIICEKAIAWSVQMVDARRIDEINILRSSFEAMTKAVENLSVTPQLLSIDGNRFWSQLKIPFNCFVKGDGRYANIAAASVLAKTFRDDYMVALDKEYPQYGWSKNKGYPTKDHQEALEKYGLSPYHRKTFSVKKQQLTLF